jgi:hypothetical protein
MLQSLQKMVKKLQIFLDKEKEFIEMLKYEIK